MSANKAPRNYNLRSTASAGAVHPVETAEDPVPALEPEAAVEPEGEPEQDQFVTMATGYKLEKFRGDGTDDVEDFLRKFDRYVNLCGTKENQRFDLLCLHLEGRASWYVDSIHPQPADLAALRNALTHKFKAEPAIKMEVFKMKQLDIETINDFIHRVEKETQKLNFPDQLKVQIAVDGLEPSIRSAISSHGPATLEDVRKLANRVQGSTSVFAGAVAPPTHQDTTMQQILGLL